MAPPNFNAEELRQIGYMRGNSSVLVGMFSIVNPANPTNNLTYKIIGYFVGGLDDMTKIRQRVGFGTRYATPGDYLAETFHPTSNEEVFERIQKEKCDIVSHALELLFYQWKEERSKATALEKIKKFKVNIPYTPDSILEELKKFNPEYRKDMDAIDDTHINGGWQYLQDMKLPKIKDYKENKMFWKTKKEYAEECKQLKAHLIALESERNMHERRIAELRRDVQCIEHKSAEEKINYAHELNKVRQELAHLKNDSEFAKLKEEHEKLKKDYEKVKEDHLQLSINKRKQEAELEIAQMGYKAQDKYIAELRKVNENHSPTGLLNFAESVVSMVKDLKSCDTPVIKIGKGEDK